MRAVDWKSVSGAEAASVLQHKLCELDLLQAGV